MPDLRRRGSAPVRDTAFEVGRRICEGALRVGFSGLNCYDHAFLASLGWMAGAMLLAAAVVASRKLV